MQESKYSRLGLMLFFLTSVLTHLVELGLTTYVCYWLYDTGQTVWMALITGLLTVPLLAVQLMSYMLHSLRLAEKKEGEKTGCDVVVVLWHVLQMGLVWRYCRLAYSARISGMGSSGANCSNNCSSTPTTATDTTTTTISNTTTTTKSNNNSSNNNNSKKGSKELWEVLILRCSHVFSSTILILSAQTYLAVTLHKDTTYTATSLWPVFTSITTSLVSTSWVLATFKRTKNACCVVGAISWSGLAAKLIWRLGEVSARILILCLFASCHHWWLFLVLAFHVCSMVALNILDNVLLETGLVIWWDIFLKPLASIFCYFNAGFPKSKYGFALYYTLSSLESITLLILWLVYDSQRHLHLPLTLVVVILYLTSLVAAVVYYTCYHRKELHNNDTKTTSTVASNSDAPCVHQCVKCRLRCCVRHKMSRPYMATWVDIQDNPSPKFTDMLNQSEYESARRGQHPQNRTVYPPDPTTSHSVRGHKVHTSNRIAKHILGEDVDFIWDDYDMQEIPEFDTGTFDAVPMQDGCEEFALSQLYGLTVDNGYYSGVSSSYNDPKIDHGFPVDNTVSVLPSGPRDLSSADISPGLPSDNLSVSVVSNVSSRVPILSCHHCGHTMSLDSSSLHSGTTAASFSSHLLPQVMAHAPRSPGYWKQKKRPARRRSMPNRHYKADGQAIGQDNGGATCDSTAESEVWEPTSDSEV